MLLEFFDVMHTLICELCKPIARCYVNLCIFVVMLTFVVFLVISILADTLLCCVMLTLVYRLFFVM